MNFNKYNGRSTKHSIYRTEISQEFYDHDKVEVGIKKTKKRDCKQAVIPMAKQSKRDMT